MQFLNHDFYSNVNIVSYIDASMQTLINSNQTILNSLEHLLFYYIKEDFNANFYSLYNTDIDMDCLGFSVIQRNTRHSIEAYLDLVNLISDPDYLSVMEYCARTKREFNRKYKPYIKKNKIFNIPVKYDIATKLYNRDIPEVLLKVASNSNNYSHPNVFIKIIKPDEFSEKAFILRKLLNANLFVLTEAYKLIVQKFNNATFPILNCQNCNPFLARDCGICFENEKAKFQNLIDNGLITYTSPVQTGYQQPPVIR